MTKLLFCIECGDMVMPYAEMKKPRWCRCGRHAIWWMIPTMGILEVYDKQRPTEGGNPMWKSACRVIGIHNEFLQRCITTSEKDKHLTYRERWKDILEDTSDHYLFKSWETPMVIIMVGMTGDISWADNVPE